MRSSTPPRAVSITIGTRLVSRTLRHTAKPSVSGIITSSTTMSGASLAIARNPSSGWCAAATANPNGSRYSVSRPQSASSSSISSTRVRAGVAMWCL